MSRDFLDIAASVRVHSSTLLEVYALFGVCVPKVYAKREESFEGYTCILSCHGVGAQPTILLSVSIILLDCTSLDGCC